MGGHGPDDVVLVGQGDQDVVDGIVQLGYQREFGLNYMAVEPGQMLAVSFTPELVFDQTPGPLAGRAMTEAGAQS